MYPRTFYIKSQRIKYQETKLKNPVFAKCYLIKNPYRDQIVAIPDGCIDFQFVWEGEKCRGYVCGSYLKGNPSKIGTYQKCFGLKLHPGVLFSFLETSQISLFIENRISLEQFLNISSLETQLQYQDSFSDLMERSLNFFQRQSLYPTHNIARETMDIILQTSGSTRISEIVQSLGYSHHYVNNLFKLHYGIPTKKYAEIVRAQAAIESLYVNDVMDVVDELGYYDQAHFIRAFKNCTSLTPNSFLSQLHAQNGTVIV